MVDECSGKNTSIIPHRGREANKMANNKRPRKKYRPKPVRFNCWKLSDIEHLQAVFQDFELITELKFPTGEATMDDMTCVRDVLNLCTMGLVTRDWLDKDEVKECTPVVNAAGDAIKQCACRACERSPDAPRFVFTGDELKAVRAGVAIAGPYIRESFECSPTRIVMEFFAMRHLTRGKDGSYAYTDEQLKRAVLKQNDNIDWSHRYERT